MTMSAALDATRRFDWESREEKGGWSDGLRRLLVLKGDDVIHMLERRHGYFPKVFAWRGRRYDVYAVERCWTVTRRGLRGKVERYCFRVRARSRAGRRNADGTFEIYQDLQNCTWHMQRQVG
jgi:hypothetical protein